MIESKVENSLKSIGTGYRFLKRLPMAQTQRSKINKRDLMKLKSFIKAKDTVNLTNQQHNRMETFFSAPHLIDD